MLAERTGLYIDAEDGTMARGSTIFAWVIGLVAMLV